MRSLNIVAGTLLLAAAVGALAENYPSRPVRLVVPYAAGGSTDVLARMVGQRLTETLGQPVVVDNRTGAGTLIATDIVAHAAPDGYTLLMATPPLVVAAALYQKVSFDAARDFAAITNIAATSNVLVVHPSVAAQSVRELIALARAQPGRLAYGSSGIGGASHLAVALFASSAGIDLLHVPYKGGSLAVTDLLGGRLSLMFANLTTVQQHIKSGRVRALAIGTAQSQKPVCPGTKPTTGTVWSRRPPRRALSSNGYSVKFMQSSKRPRCASACCKTHSNRSLIRPRHLRAIWTASA